MCSTPKRVTRCHRYHFRDWIYDNQLAITPPRITLVTRIQIANIINTRPIAAIGCFGNKRYSSKRCFYNIQCFHNLIIFILVNIRKCHVMHNYTNEQHLCTHLGSPQCLQFIAVVLSGSYWHNCSLCCTTCNIFNCSLMCFLISFRNSLICSLDGELLKLNQASISWSNSKLVIFI